MTDNTTRETTVSRSEVEGRLTNLVAYAMFGLADRALAMGLTRGDVAEAEKILARVPEHVPDDVTRLAREVLLYGIFGEQMSDTATH